jgi:hypothetical protein
MTDDNNNQQIVIYQTEGGETQIDVRLEQETVWLSQAQMSALFDKDSDTIGLHLKNIYKEGELIECSTTEKSSVVRLEGKRQVRRSIKMYNLDAILSVGYRVNSKKGTQFRIWANKVLKQYLMQGYALNERKLQAEQEKLNELKSVIALTARLAQNKDLSPTESQSILTVLEKYSHALTVLDDYDHQRLMVVGTTAMVQPKIDYHEAKAQIYLWREKEKLGGLFGNEKDNSFNSALETIYQTFDGKSFTQALKKKQRTCCILLLKTMPLAMVTSALPQPCLLGFYSVMSTYTTKWAKSALQIMPWWRSPYLLQKVSLSNAR